MRQRFHTEESSDPPHEGEMIKTMWRSSQGQAFGCFCMGVHNKQTNAK